MKKIILSLLVLGVGLMFSCKNSNMKTDKAEYSGKDISKEASIIRNKDTKTLELHIDTPDKWVLYAGTSVEGIDFSKPIAEGEGRGTFPLNVVDSIRSYFQLITPEGKAILAERHLPMAGGYNFRDLGGIRTADGRFTKWGKIFRSDDLHHLTDQDLAYLSSIPLVSIVDFRSPDEIKHAPDKLPASVKASYDYSISPGNLFSVKNIADLNANQIDDIMMGMNRLFVTDSVCINSYKNLFTLLQDDKDVPLMFHCSAGKDRTGLGAALVLYALGVDENVIFEDYLLSNTYLGNKYASYMDENPHLKPLFEVNKKFLKAGIDQIKKDHGTIQNYLTEVLGVDIPKFKKKYLY